MRLAHGRQNTERFLILPLEELFCPAGMVESGIAYGTDVNLKTVVFHDSRRGVLEGMFAAKIGQHAFQALGATSWGHANGLRQQPDIARLLGLPNPFGHPHLSEHAPPT
jgi:hypothetical protein